MECEICGRQIYGRQRVVIIDGAKLMVCSDCAKSAPEVPLTHKQQPPSTKKSSRTQIVNSPRPVRDGRSTMRENLELIVEYSSTVRKAREKAGMTHKELSRKIGEKISLLQKMETGKMVPSQAVAKKLEHTLKIKLLKPPTRISVEETFAKKPEKRTIGDFFSMQQKKDEKVEG